MKKYLILICISFAFKLSVSGQITYQQFADSLQGDFETWVTERVENAKKGIVEKIEMPMVVRTRAWGCRCPDNYMGVGVNTKEGPWIFPVSTKKLPTPDENGHSLVVVGHFTGKIIDLDLREGEEEPDEWFYHLPEFKITSWKKNTRDYEVDAPKIIK